MSGKERFEHYVGNILDHQREAERWAEVARRTRADNHALHQPDQSSGSETLDD